MEALTLPIAQVYKRAELLLGAVLAADLSDLSLVMVNQSSWSLTAAHVTWHERGSFSGPERYSLRIPLPVPSSPTNSLCAQVVVRPGSGNGDGPLTLEGASPLWTNQ